MNTTTSKVTTKSKFYLQVPIINEGKSKQLK